MHINGVVEGYHEACKKKKKQSGGKTEAVMRKYVGYLLETEKSNS